MKNIYISIIFLLFFSIFAKSQTSTLTVNVFGIENAKGNLHIAIFDEKNNKSFTKKTENAINRKIIKVTGNIVSVSFKNIPFGVYAVSIFHDENSNGKLDRNPVGIPSEAFGSSGNSSSFGPPKFDDCKFTIKSVKQKIEIEIKSLF